MIKQLQIENFQSHKSTTLDFCPGINIILGSNDQGKSAIKRALKWVAENRPLGDDIRSDWGGDTSSKITVEEGEVKRLRTDSKNQYIVSGHPKPLESFKQSIPEPVMEILNMGDINFQHQMDAPFLLSKTPPEITRYINELCNLDSIDRAYKNINAEITKWKTKVEQKEIDIKIEQEKVDNLSWISEAEGRLVCIETKQKIINQRRKTVADLFKLIEQGKELSNELEMWPDLAGIRVKIDKAIGLHRELKKHRENVNKLASEIRQGRALENKILNLSEKIVKYKQKFEKMMPDTCPLCGRGD